MSDLIDRQDAIEAIMGLPTWWADDGGYYGGAQPPMEALLDPKDVVSAIENLPSAEPERRWIPVAEALPKEETDVLLQFSKNLAVGYQEDGDWMIATGSGWYSGLDEEEEEKPIAWMPLLEPLRGE